jgi:hypothetical protein
MTKKREKDQVDSFSPIQLKTIIPATHYFPLSQKNQSEVDWQM